MCGIIGFIGYSSEDALKMAKNGLFSIDYRGRDATGVEALDGVVFGHNLHSIVGYVKQPLVSENGLITSNCEIYNWQALEEKNGISARNDSEFILKYFEKFGAINISKLAGMLDGDYSIAYYSKKEKKLFLLRDIAGVKPLVYWFDSKKRQFAFSSEKKALAAVGINGAIHLNPRKILIYDIKKNKISFKSQKIQKQKIQNPVMDIQSALTESVSKRIPEKKFGLLFSGGLDSAILAKLLSAHRKCECYFAFVSGENGFALAKDFMGARKSAQEMGLTLSLVKTTLGELEEELPRLISLIESTDPVRVSVAATIYFAAREMKKNNVKVAFSGIGADELFAGYSRFKNSTDINKDTFSYFIKLYENDLYFEDIVCMKNSIELRVPFLDKQLTEKALSLDSKYKIDAKTGENKKVLRMIAVKIGLSKEIATKPKKAAQYGSNFDKAIEVLAKKNNFKSKADYLNSLSSNNHLTENNSVSNIPIGALISTGKDSLFAMHLMQKQGYEVKCLITIESKNKDSFMFHTPTVELAKLQAEALGLPLVIAKTSGEKEKELLDLKKALITAQKIYGIEGVCSGALYSNYQRERIETICEKIGVRSFAPLWHMNQISYLKQLVDSGFEVIITKIAAQGFNEKWLGRKIDSNAIVELEKLEKKLGINPAGEGGEYESLVINAPFFKKKIELEFEKKTVNEFSGELIIKKAGLVEK